MFEIPFCRGIIDGKWKLSLKDKYKSNYILLTYFIACAIKKEKEVNGGVCIEMFVSYIWVCEVARRYERLCKTYIFEKCSLLLLLKLLDLHVCKQMSSGYCMLCTIVWCHVQCDIMFARNKMSMSQKKEQVSFQLFTTYL